MTEQDDKTQEFLAHYGVKGMRWGKTTKSDAGGSSAPASTYSRSLAKEKVSNDDIYDARLRVYTQSQAVRREIKDIKAQAKAGKTAVDKVAINEAKAALYNNPDRVTASRMTTGDKVVAGIIALSTGPGAPVSLAVNFGTRAAQTRSIAKAQDTGKYNRKFGV